MTKKRIIESEIGTSHLELAIWLVVFSAFLIVAFNIVQHIQRQRFVENVLDKNVRSSSLRPFQLKNSTTISINTEALNSYLLTLANALNVEINQTAGIEAERLIEVAYATVPINTETGVALSLGEIKSRQQIGSSSFVSAEKLAKTDLSMILKKYVGDIQTSSTAFLYATPLTTRGTVLNQLTQSAGIISASTAYAPEAVFILARVLLAKTSNTPAKFVYEKIGLEPVYGAIKIVNLRGDYEL